MTRRTWLTVVLFVLGALTTLVIYGAAVIVTAFLACGVSGCSGGGFGPAFSPTEAQIGVLVAGLCLLPLAAALAHRALRGRRHQLMGTVVAGWAAVVVGSVLAMLLSGIGPGGCPTGQSRATVGGDGSSAGDLTCSGDEDAVPNP